MNKVYCCTARCANEPNRHMAQKAFKQRKQIRLRNFNYSAHEHVFFITICTVDKQPYFSDPKISKIVIDELEYRRVEKETKLFCYCIMPNHIHLLISLNENYTKKEGAFGERTLQNWVSAFKRYTSRVSNQLHDIKPLWQANFFDHVVRKDESLVEIRSYILNNPVRKGMASNWEEYPCSRMVDDLPI